MRALSAPTVIQSASATPGFVIGSSYIVTRTQFAGEPSPFGANPMDISNVVDSAGSDLVVTGNNIEILTAGAYQATITWELQTDNGSVSFFPPSCDITLTAAALNPPEGSYASATPSTPYYFNTITSPVLYMDPTAFGWTVQVSFASVGDASSVSGNIYLRVVRLQ